MKLLSLRGRLGVGTEKALVKTIEEARTETLERHQDVVAETEHEDEERDDGQDHEGGQRTRRPSASVAVTSMIATTQQSAQ